MFQHHGQLYVQLGGRSRFHRPHRPAHGDGGVLPGHVGAGRQGSVTWRGSVLWHRLSPAAGPVWTASSISVRTSVQRSQQQPSGQTHPVWRSPTRGQTWAGTVSMCVENFLLLVWLAHRLGPINTFLLQLQCLQNKWVSGLQQPVTNDNRLGDYEASTCRKVSSESSWSPAAACSSNAQMPFLHITQWLSRSLNGEESNAKPKSKSKSKIRIIQITGGQKVRRQNRSNPWAKKQTKYKQKAK